MKILKSLETNMKTQNLYKSLEHEIKERKNNLTKHSWRGDLSKRGLDRVQWGDLKCIQDQVVNTQNVK